MEKFTAASKYGFSNKPEDLLDLVSEALQAERPDSIDELRAQVSNLQNALARLLVVLYANGNSSQKFRLGLDVDQLNDVLGNAGIREIAPVK